MKRRHRTEWHHLIYLIALGLYLNCVMAGNAQGMFFGYNGSAPTRLGDPQGALAGPNVLAQFWVGLTPEYLAPMRSIRPHHDGIAINGRITVPGTQDHDTAYVQLWAWDSSLWGIESGSVPLDQFGRTDLVPVELGIPVNPSVIVAPHFNVAAIVPIPEPTFGVLLGLGGVTLWAMALKSPQARAGSKRRI